MSFVKYPRTRHVRGSRLQKGDHDLEAVPFEELRGKFLVVEEKIDGANAGVSFENGKLALQSRGHYLRGGPREAQFDLLKQWAGTWWDDLNILLDERYVMYGEWMYAKHTCFYDLLPHYFMEFDVYDRKTNVFLSTSARQKLLREHGGVVIEPVLVLAAGQFDKIEDLQQEIGRSHFKTQNWKAELTRQALLANEDPDFALEHTDPSDDMEGLYIKWEDEGTVKGRYKFVRESFTNAILEQEQHWHDRAIIPNQLRPGAYERMFGTF